MPTLVFSKLIGETPEKKITFFCDDSFIAENLERLMEM